MTQPISICEESPPLLQMKGIDKSFPGVHALSGIDMTLRRGEVLALVGENGAGKSTLIKVLAGAHLPDSGEILIEGRDPQIHSPTSACGAGVSVIYQEFNLVPELTVRENIFLGREAVRHGFINAKTEHRQSLELFQNLGIDVDPDARCSELSVAQQQSVEIAKALAVDARIVVMDEPTAALTTQEVQRLFAIIRELRSQRMGVVYISHRLEEIFEVADRVMVLRDGRHVGTYEIDDITLARLIELMVGRPLEAEFPPRSVEIGQERLRVQNLTRADSVRDVSFHVRAGEVVGFAGLVGSGRTETMRIIFGADTADSGRICIDGVERRIRSPRDAIRSRICLLTEDRKGQGLVLIHSARENFGLPNLDQFRRGVFLDQAKEHRRFGEFIDSLKIRISEPDQIILTLSGGNQQKVVLAKWLASNADIIIFDEPTRGIDVAAKYEIYLIMNELAVEGKAIIMISSELPEILGMSDRIIVMHHGRITGRIEDVQNATQEDIMTMAIA
jgi:ABC-type sugar transport system ATPase subunit